MIDSHCHLADKKFAKDLDQVISRAVDAGVEKMICIADTLEEAERCVSIADTYDNVFATVGLHPHGAKDWQSEDLNRLREMIASSDRVVAVGEIGLDYHYDHSPREVQRSVFRAQLELAKELDLPAVIHNRESIDDLKKIVAEVQPTKLVIHCCTDKWEDVSDLVDRGAFLSFTGIATYPTSETIRETICNCPIQQLMIETDAPYLAPQGLRGKRCEPAYVVEVAKLVSELKKISLEEVDRVTTVNTEVFFGLAKTPMSS